MRHGTPAWGTMVVMSTFLLHLAVLWAGLAPSAPPSGGPASQPATLSDDQLNSLVDQLADKSYRVRAAASDRLGQASIKDLDRLAPFYKRATNEEQRIRLHQVALTVFLTAREAEAAGPGFLGIALLQMDAEDPAGPAQVLIQDLVPGSPAADAGLRPNDILTRLDGKPIHSTEKGGLADQIRAIRAGEKITLTVLRDDKTFDVTVKLAPRARFNLDDGGDWLVQFGEFWRNKFDPNAQAAVGGPVIGPRRIRVIDGGMIVEP